MMSEAVSTPAATRLAKWSGRVRFLFAVGLVWAGLHFLLGQTLMPSGLQRPCVLMGGAWGPLTGVFVVVLLWMGAWVAARVVGRRHASHTPLIVGLALALWAAPGGTMDDWLTFRNPSVNQSAAPAYWLLAGDYLFLLAGIVGSIAIGALRGADVDVRDGTARRRVLREAFALEQPVSEIRRGALALLVNVAVASVALLFLTGPRIAWTRRGQVYFAVAVAFVLGLLVAQQVVRTTRPQWHWVAPFLVGLIGVVVAGLQPQPPAPYGHVNIIPAFGLVRPLPVEMVGVGLVATFWMRRATHAQRAEPGSA